MAATVLWAALLGGCPVSPGVPDVDSCANPNAITVESLEIGAPTLDSVFQPWMDNDPVAFVIGDQGSAMIPMRIRLRGAIGGCVFQHTTFTDAGGELFFESSVALGIYRQSDGSFVTNTHWLIVNGPRPVTGDRAIVTTTVAATTTSRTLVLTQ